MNAQPSAKFPAWKFPTVSVDNFVNNLLTAARKGHDFYPFIKL